MGACPWVPEVTSSEPGAAIVTQWSPLCIPLWDSNTAHYGSLPWTLDRPLSPTESQIPEGDSLLGHLVDLLLLSLPLPSHTIHRALQSLAWFHLLWGLGLGSRKYNSHVIEHGNPAFLHSLVQAKWEDTEDLLVFHPLSREGPHYKMCSLSLD